MQSRNTVVALAKQKPFDKPLVILILTLTLFGLLILSSAAFGHGERRFGDPYRYVKTQIAYGIGLGSILFLLGLRIPVEIYRKRAVPILLGSLFLVTLVFIPALQVKVSDSARWIRIGNATFQPSEALKLGFVMFLAAWLAARKKSIKETWGGLMPFLFITGIVCSFLMLEKDAGSLGVIGFTALLLFILAGASWRHIVATIALAALAFSFLLWKEPYMRTRVEVFLDPYRDAQDSGYQIIQGLIAIGSGGMFGRGWGLSRQKFQYLPEPAGDMIFTIFAEEQGFFGSLLLLALFFAFFWRGMLIAARIKDPFSRYLAAGITILVMVQVVINIAAVSKLMPLTGIPLPFVSHGGSALAILLFEMGILVNLSRKTA